jgi:Secretion system C-terminal sorting domain
MKKLLLLCVAGSLALGANAQYAHSMFSTRTMGDIVQPTNKKPVMYTSDARARTTTSATTGAWFIYDVAADPEYGLTSGSSTYGLINTYPDSNIYYPGGSPSAFYIWAHGIGTSFDPTSPYYTTAWAPTVGTSPDFAVDSTQPYIVDSVNVLGLYQRINSTTDTLFVDLTYTSDTGAWKVTYSGADLVTYGICNPPSSGTDTTWSIGDAYYDYANNSIDATNTTPVWHITKILDAAAYADSTSNGLHQWSFGLTTTSAYTVTSSSGATSMNVPAHAHVVAYAHFGSGTAYSYGTANTAANLWSEYSVDFGYNPLQTFADDDNSGLLSSTDDRYHLTGYSYLNLSGGGTAPMLTPTYFYTAPLAVHDPWFGFYLRSPVAASTSVNAVKSIKSVVAYPNPTSGQLNIGYTLNNNSDVTVTLTNMLGQVVATQTGVNGKAVFNTTSIADGMYIYTVQANGERATGRVSVAH